MYHEHHTTDEQIPAADRAGATVPGPRGPAGLLLPTSRHDFTQAQRFALLALKTFFKTDYRGIVAIVRDWPQLQKDLGLAKLPDHTTLWYAQRRLLGVPQRGVVR